MKETKVWDLAVRTFHWALVAFVAVAFLTSDSDDLISWHARAGIVIAGLLVFRLIWGVVGPKHARFGSFVKGPRAVVGYLRDYVRGKPPIHQSHNPLGAVMVVVLLAVLFGAVLTGSLAYGSAEWDGPFSAVIGEKLGDGLEDVHEALASSLYFLIPAHILGVIVSSLLEKQNLVKGMFTGRKRAVDEDPVQPASKARMFGAVSIAVAIAVGLGLFLVPGKAKADVPSAQALLRTWERQTRAKDPSFAGFSTVDGAKLYETEFTQKGKQVSCTTCHAVDPTQSGRTPKGKRVKPLAPSANKSAFSKPPKSEKKFDRYCKEVLGRVCTTREKGDLLAWLLAR